MSNFGLDNIMDEFDFFSGDVETPEANEVVESQEPEVQEQQEPQEDNNLDDINVDDLFGDSAESNSEPNNNEMQEPSESEGSSSFYNTIAQAMKSDGLLHDLEGASIEDIKTPEEFSEFMEKYINSKFDEKQRKVNEALGLGVEASEIKKYEQAINYLDNITDANIRDESEQGEILRKRIIYNDLINHGVKPETAERRVAASMKAGDDIEDALEALQSAKEYYKEGYDELIADARKAQEVAKEANLKQAEKLQSEMLSADSYLGSLNVDKALRKKAYENISKPVYKDPNTGEQLTAIQKYERENHSDFLKNVAMIYTLTDGFQNLDKLVKPEVNKAVNKGIKDLQKTLNNTSRNSGGDLKFVTNYKSDPNSYSGNGWVADV